MKYLFVFLMMGLSSIANSQYATATQPDCGDLLGLQTIDVYGEMPEDYTGIAFECKDGKVKRLHNYKEGKHDGLCREWYENGQLEKEVNYKDDEEDGMYRRWHENGQESYSLYYNDGEKAGNEKYWYESGQRKSEGMYKLQTIVGSTTPGSLTSFITGVPYGLHRSWYENGQLKSETNYKNQYEDFDGELDGVSRHYYENGQLEWEANYKDGKKDGLDRSWYKNGQVKSGSFIDGYGQLESQTNWIDDRQEGLSRSWYENGQLKSKVKFIDGVGEGIQSEWFENGQLKSKTMLKNGREDGIYRKWWKDNGKLKLEGNYYSYLNDSDKSNDWWPSVLDGWYTEYYLDGDVKNTGKYWKGEKIGVWRFYYDTAVNKEQKRRKAVFSDAVGASTGKSVLISKECWDIDGNERECDY